MADSAPLPPTSQPSLGAARLWVVVLPPLLVQAFFLYEIYNYGPLSGFVPWDDCLFVLRDLANLDSLSHATSLASVLGMAQNLYIHSPVADLQTFLGLLLTGGHVWGAYALGAPWLMLAAYAVLRACGPSRSLAAALLIFVLIQPMAMSSLYLKADWKGGVMIAAAIYVIHEAGRRNDDRLKDFGAWLLSLSLLTKLSAFYMPVVAIGILALFDVFHVWCARPAGVGPAAAPRYILQAYSEQARRRSFDRRLAITVAPFIFVYLLSTVTGDSIVAYIHNALSDTWSDHRTLAQRAIFYSPFSEDGRLTWGSIPAMFGLSLLACAALAVVRRGWAALAALGLIILVAAVLLVPLVVAKTSNITFGATLFGVVMAGALIGMSGIARALPRRGGQIVLGVSILLTVGLKLTPMSIYYGADHTLPANWELREIKARYAPMIDYMARSPSRFGPRTLVFFEYLWAPYPNIAIESFQRSGRMMEIMRVNSIADRGVPQDMAQSDFALTFAPTRAGDGPGLTGLEARYPASAHPLQSDAFVAAQPHYERVMTTPVRGGEVRLYVNRAVVKAEPPPQIAAAPWP